MGNEINRRNLLGMMPAALGIAASALLSLALAT